MKTALVLFIIVEQRNKEIQTYYTVRPRTPDFKVWRLKKLQTRKKIEYDVAVTPEGWITCTCQDAVYRERVCKHAQAMQECGLLNTPTQ